MKKGDAWLEVNDVELEAMLRDIKNWGIDVNDHDPEKIAREREVLAGLGIPTVGNMQDE